MQKYPTNSKDIPNSIQITKGPPKSSSFKSCSSSFLRNNIANIFVFIKFGSIPNSERLENYFVRQPSHNGGSSSNEVEFSYPDVLIFPPIGAFPKGLSCVG